MKIKKILSVCIVMTGMITMGLTGCGTSKETTAKDDETLTVYLWDTDLIRDLTPYIHEQLPDKDIEFVAGNNDTDLYSYLEEHGELPDIITVRRFAGTDARDLQPYLIDFSAYDVVSEYSSYSLQYYKNDDGEINWLPICGIPQTIIANRTLFEEYGLELPQNYNEYVNACQIFSTNGIKPYALDLAEDWSSHEMVQAGGIGELTSLDGIAWRNGAESAHDTIGFDDTMWKNIFSETANLLKDSCFTQEDLDCDTDAAMQLFVEGKAAMFHGSPVHMRQCQEQMDDELVRLPYFSQTSEERFIYMTPSLHIAFNKELEDTPGKLETAMDVLECMISEEGQKLIANGDSVISFNPDVPSIADDMTGLEDEIENNNYYIRYSSQKSFAASVTAVRGLLTGTMDETEAYEAFRNAINSEDNAAETSVVFEKEYSISLNDKNGRDAASSILTTIREERGADLAFAPYYYFTSSIYKGECTDNRLNLMIANKPNAPSLYLGELTGAEVKELVERYLTSTDGKFQPTDRYGLPVASGMKIVVQGAEDGFSLKEILTGGKELEDEKEYSVLLTDDVISVLDKMDTEHKFEQLDDTTLSVEWTTVMNDGNQPAEPEDYIQIR